MSDCGCELSFGAKMEFCTRCGAHMVPGCAKGNCRVRLRKLTRSSRSANRGNKREDLTRDIRMTFEKADEKWMDSIGCRLGKNAKKHRKSRVFKNYIEIKCLRCNCRMKWLGSMKKLDGQLLRNAQSATKQHHHHQASPLPSQNHPKTSNSSLNNSPSTKKKRKRRKHTSLQDLVAQSSGSSSASGQHTPNEQYSLDEFLQNL